MLETLQQTNIGHLNLVEPQRGSGLPFDVERDITKSDWEGIFGYVSKLAMSGVYSDRTNFNEFSFVKLLSPKKFQDEYDKQSFDFDRKLQPYLPAQAHLTGEDINLLLNQETLAHESISSSTLRYCQELLTTKVLFPENHNLFRNSRRILDRVISIYGGNQFVPPQEVPSVLVALKIIYPGEFSEEPYGSSGVLEGMEARIKYFKGVKIYHRFMRELANFKMLVSPLRFRSAGYLDEDAWEIMKNQFIQTRITATKYIDQRWMEFSEEAFYMKVLAVDEVRISDQGLEFINPEPKATLTLSTPALPEVRKF
ncbi:MAG: hypothetical protein Q7R49_01930 [Candidatus Daviesbacteria bacterium]|nr:hypothetical protein [Candidatus Daviesbacteria bacterium]